MRRWTIMAGTLALPALALAQSATFAPPPPPPPEPPVAQLPAVNIVGAAPLLGSGIARDKVASGVASVGAKDVIRTGLPNALGALSETVPGVALDNAAGNEFQPNLVYRGFTASPNDGSDEGLAVYVNGARFNQPFGDTVLWDLIPSIAVGKIDVEGANPVFGLNALGGSVNLRLKNGFTYHGGEIDAYGGSFGRAATSFQYGRESNGTAAYIAANLLHEDGWRQLTQSDLRQVYGDLGWRGNKGEAHASIIGAQNDLNGPGTSPVQWLAVNRALQYTAPNVVHNKYLQGSLSATYDISDDTSLQGLLYVTSLNQRVVNGNTPSFQPCNAGGGLCESDGVTPLTVGGGSQIPDYLNGGPYSRLNLNFLNSTGYGGSLQASSDGDVFGHTNRLVAGVSYDGATSTFGATTLTGGLSDARSWLGPGFTIDQSDGSIAPVKVIARNGYYGVYASDVFDLTEKLSATLSGRFNAAQVTLHDQVGTALDGNHQFNRFNPGVGLTYKIAPMLSAYASYAESNRAPTPAELSCASLASPCTLANFFVGDPDLKQVVARTVEAGLRGTLTPFVGAGLKWDVDFYRTETADDIVFAPSATPGFDFFQNVAHTRRQGIEANLRLERGPVSVTLGYALTDATFQSVLTLDSELNPAADANGQIHVRAGNRLPGVPLHQVKLGADWRVTPRWTVGARGLASSGQYLFGDEANLTPTTGAYFVLNANTSYRIGEHLDLFALAQNVLNARYATYGTFTDAAAVSIPQVPNPNNPRALSPAAPVAVYGGARLTF